MKTRHNQAVTLIETLIVLALLGLVILGFSSVDIFSRNQVTSADRHTKLQSDSSYVLEHMTKEIGKAIGNASQSVNTANIGNSPAVRVWIDYNLDGQKTSADRQIAYVFQNRQSGRDDRYQIWYYPSYSRISDTHEILSYKIVKFEPAYIAGDSYVSTELVACWDPTKLDASSPCWDVDSSLSACQGTPDNPCVVIQNQISMPGVSTH